MCVCSGSTDVTSDLFDNLENNLRRGGAVWNCSKLEIRGDITGYFRRIPACLNGPHCVSQGG